MRDIEFRGKEEKTGEWVYGSLLIREGDASGGKQYFIVHPKRGVYRYDECKVIPETVGQYTGLRDKNGVKIFEGDIIKVKQIIDDVVFDPEYRTLTGEITFQRGGFWFHGSGWAINDWHFYNAEDLEIIGNIHDNPKLLKEAKP